MKIKLTISSILTFSIFAFAVPEKSYADYIPQSFIDAVREQKAKQKITSEPKSYPYGFPQSFIDAVREQKAINTNESVQSNNFTDFITRHNPKLQKNVVNKIAVNVAKYSNDNKVDPKLVLALMARESSFRSNAVSKSGAIGLGQLKRSTAKDMGVTDPFNIIENIRGTVKYLSWLLKRNDGDIDTTLASYNMGPGAVKRSINAGITLPEKVEKYVDDIKSFHSMI